VINNPDPESRWVMEVNARTLRAKNYVGVIQTRSGVAIEILPKVDLQGASEHDEREVFLRMLRRWRDGPFRDFNDAEIKAVRDFPLLEAFISMFLKDLRELTRRGLACAYHEVDDNLHYLKGKLLIAPHLRHNLVHKERCYVRYETFSANRPINRLLKSTLRLLRRVSRNDANRARIRQAQLAFEDIPHSSNIAADLIRARTDRTMPLYSRLFPWARLFLTRQAPTPWRDRNPAVAVLFPMQAIFEDYVAHLVRAASPGWECRTQENRHHLIDRNPDNKAEFRLRPDIVARHRGDKTIRVMDAKWKRLNRDRRHHDISQTDLYQLYAYGKKYAAAECCAPQLYLLYPRNENFIKQIEFHYEDNLRLTVFPVSIALEEKLINAHAETESLHDLLAPDDAPVTVTKAKAKAA
ncbi:MAG: McrC family protein, partial [bacterium]